MIMSVSGKGDHGGHAVCALSSASARASLSYLNIVLTSHKI